jgi:hypothetical protein
MSGKLPASPRFAKKRVKCLPRALASDAMAQVDVFFAQDASSRGMSWEEIASFVGHTEEEVCQKPTVLDLLGPRPGNIPSHLIWSP